MGEVMKLSKCPDIIGLKRCKLWNIRQYVGFKIYGAYPLC